MTTPTPPKRRCRIACLDFEEYSQPIVLLYDGFVFALFLLVVYWILRNTDISNGYVYIGIGVLMWLWILITDAVYHVAQVLIVSKNTFNFRFKDTGKVISLMISATTGYRYKRGAVGVFEWMLNISFRNILLSIFFSSALCFTFAVFYTNTESVWFTTYTTYPSLVVDIGCDVITIFETAAEIFFTVTNNILVIDIATYLDGLYFNLLIYRERIRVFYQLIFPDLEIACKGGSVQVIFTQDPVAQTMSIIWGLIACCVPFYFFRSTRYIFHKSMFWLVAFASVAAAAVSMIILNDIGTSVSAWLLSSEGATFNRVYTSHGILGFTCFILMMVSSLLLAIPTFAVLGLEDDASSSMLTLETKQRKLWDKIEYGDDVNMYTLIHGYLLYWKNSWIDLIRKIIHVLLSEAFLFSVLVAMLALYTGSLGFPLKHISFQALNTPTYPAFANLNDFEVTLYTASSLRDLITGLMQDQTNGEKILFQEILGPISNLCYAGVCVSQIIGGVDELADLVGDLNLLLVNAAFDALEEIPDFTSIEAEFEKIISPLTLIAYSFYGFLTTIEDIIHTDIIELIPQYYRDVSPYFFFIIVVLCMWSTIMGLLIPAFASFFHMSLAMFLFQVVAGGTFIIITARILFMRLGYDLILTFDYYTSVMDVLTLVLTIVSCLMLMSFQVQLNQYDPITDKLIRQIEADFKTPHEESKAHELDHLLNDANSKMN